MKSTPSVELPGLLQSLPAAWLTAAEFSLSPAAPTQCGLSLFLDRTDDLRTLLSLAGVTPTPVLEAEQWLRGTLGAGLRHWLKLSYHEGHLAGWSQYAHLRPEVTDPLTSLRIFQRRYGTREAAGMLADLLAPARGRPDVIWGVALKHDRGSVSPRHLCGVPRELLAPLLEACVAEGVLRQDDADTHGSWATRLGAERLFIGLNLDRPALAIDHHRIPWPASPVARDALPANLNSPTVGEWLKCRLVDGEPRWTIYAPLAAWGGLSPG